VLLRIVLCRQNAGNRDSKCENNVSDCFSGVNLTTTSTITRTQDPSIRASMDISSSIAIGILGLFHPKKIKRRLSHSSFLALMFAHTISLHWILKSHTWLPGECYSISEPRHLSPRTSSRAEISSFPVCRRFRTTMHLAVTRKERQETSTRVLLHRCRRVALHIFSTLPILKKTRLNQSRNGDWELTTRSFSTRARFSDTDKWATIL
jgi:hypothetical protein